MELVKLNLSSEEKGLLGNIAKINKFKASRVDNIYEKNPEEVINILCHSLRFLINLENNELSDLEEKKIITIKNKIKTFFNEINNLAYLAFDYQNRIPSTNYSKLIYRKNANEFIMKNQKQINYIIDYVFELGKNIPQFDPDNQQGYF